MPYNPNQPRDPGGKDGGRWVKAGGRAGDTSGRFGKKNFAGRGNQRTLAGKRLADVARAEYKNDNAKSHHRKNPTDRTKANFNQAQKNLMGANLRAYGTILGRGRSLSQGNPLQFRGLNDRFRGHPKGSPLKRAGDELFRVRIDRVRSGKTDSGRNARFSSGDN